jgi:D-alanyl-D-alanine carboxypeptidase
VDEGRVGLEEPVSRWVKGVPNGEAVTIETLLNHTSGLFSANEDVQVRRANRRLDWEEALGVLRRHGAMFCPGERWRYSNSGYDLLGRVVEQVEGRPLADSIQARVIEPLRLTGMRALQEKAQVSDVAAPQSDSAEPAIDIRQPGTAGPVAAGALDMIRFEQALLAGNLLKAQTRERMLRDLYPMFERGMYYGLGVMVYDVPDRGKRLYWIGHSGGAPGVKALSIYAPGQNAFVAVALTGDGSAEATANLLLRALETEAR